MLTQEWLASKHAPKKQRPRSDAATDGDRLGRVICDGGPDQTRAQPSPALLRGNDRWTYPQAVRVPDAVQRSSGDAKHHPVTLLRRAGTRSRARPSTDPGSAA